MPLEIFKTSRFISDLSTLRFLGLPLPELLRVPHVLGVLCLKPASSPRNCPSSDSPFFQPTLQGALCPSVLLGSLPSRAPILSSRVPRAPGALPNPYYSHLQSARGPTVPVLPISILPTPGVPGFPAFGSPRESPKPEFHTPGQHWAIASSSHGMPPKNNALGDCPRYLRQAPSPWSLEGCEGPILLGWRGCSCSKQ